MRRIVILLFFLLPFYCLCQIKTQLFVDGALVEEKVFQDTLAVKNFISTKRNKFIEEGFYFSGLDSITSDKDASKVFLHSGDHFELSIPGLKKRRILTQLSKRISHYSNNGYPFVTILLDSIQAGKDGLIGTLKVNEGPQIRYDSAFFLRKTKTNQRYIYHLLEIVPGSLFNESIYAGIESRIERSPFLVLNKPPDISFSQNRAKIYLDLDEKTANSFEGVLGLQQNPSGGTSVVGSLDFSAQNLFSSGHEFQFYWESFAEASQQLDLYYKHAFLMNAKFSPSFRFALLKQDTTFITRTTAFGINTYLGSNISLLIEYERTNGSLLSSTIEGISQRNLADYSRNFYHLALRRGFASSLNTLSQGWIWEASIGGGNKEIENNLALPVSYYDTIDFNTNFLRLESRTVYQIRIAKRQAVYHDLQVGILDNSQLLTNELYRIGGLSSLRGFNEKSIFASQYGLSRLELRSFFENSSYIYAFYDQLLFKRSGTSEYPIGIGLGFALETSTGQFSFALASGKSQSQSFSFSELRAHFGFITKF